MIAKQLNNLHSKVLIIIFLAIGLLACESQEQTKKLTKKADSNTINSSAIEDEYGNVSATNGNYNTNYKTQREFAAKVIGIIDGDTIEVLENNNPVRIRLAEIDCPESHQDFGQKAKTFTSELVFDKDVKVLVKDIDRYGRTVAEIILPDGRSLNRELISAGLAWWYQRYSSEQSLGQLQSQAKSAKLGLWSSDNPIPPWDFRHSR